jgi:hypothetical protein
METVTLVYRKLVACAGRCGCPAGAERRHPFPERPGHVPEAAVMSGRSTSRATVDVPRDGRRPRL